MQIYHSFSQIIATIPCLICCLMKYGCKSNIFNVCMYNIILCNYNLSWYGLKIVVFIYVMTWMTLINTKNIFQISIVIFITFILAFLLKDFISASMSLCVSCDRFKNLNCGFDFPVKRWWSAVVIVHCGENMIAVHFVPAARVAK